MRRLPCRSRSPRPSRRLRFNGPVPYSRLARPAKRCGDAARPPAGGRANRCAPCRGRTKGRRPPRGAAGRIAAPVGQACPPAARLHRGQNGARLRARPPAGGRAAGGTPAGGEAARAAAPSRRNPSQYNTDQTRAPLVDDPFDGLLQLHPGVGRHPVQLVMQPLVHQLVQ